MADLRTQHRHHVQAAETAYRRALPDYGEDPPPDVQARELARAAYEQALANAVQLDAIASRVGAVL